MREAAVGQSEKSLGERIRQFAMTYGFWGYHTHRSQFSEVGFPDWVFQHTGNGRTIYIETKRELPLLHHKSVLKWSQKWWLVSLRTNPYNLTLCLRPSDWSVVETVFMTGVGVLGGGQHLWRELPILGHTNPGEWDGTLTKDELLLGPRNLAILHGEIRPRMRRAS